MPDADVGDIPLLSLPAHRVSHAQDGKTDHPENMRDTPVDHCLNHDIADRARNADDFLNLYINAVLTLLNRESGDRGVGAVGILAGERIEAPAMPGAYELAVLDGALPLRTAQMRAMSVHNRVSAGSTYQGEFPVARRHGNHLVVPDIIVGGNPIPFFFSFSHEILLDVYFPVEEIETAISAGIARNGPRLHAARGRER